MSLSIRVAGVHDVEIVMNQFRKLAEDESELRPERDPFTNYFDSLRKTRDVMSILMDPLRRVFLLEDKEDVVGFLVCGLYPLTGEQHHGVGSVTYAHVDEDYPTGFAKLVDAMGRFVRPLGVTKIQFETDANNARMNHIFASRGELISHIYECELPRGDHGIRNWLATQQRQRRAEPISRAD